jgi:hypothetical protein
MGDEEVNLGDEVVREKPIEDEEVKMKRHGKKPMGDEEVREMKRRGGESVEDEKVRGR